MLKAPIVQVAAHPAPRGRWAAFTLIELLTVIAIISILASLLLPALSKGRAEAESASCKTHLRQIGVAMTMYVSDTRHYPGMTVQETGVFTPTTLNGNQTWADPLYPYYPIRWSNALWQCPSYMQNRGLILPQWPQVAVMSSYSYNCDGIVGDGWGNISEAVRLEQLGLGNGAARSDASDHGIVAPSEMYTVADARWWKVMDYDNIVGLGGNWSMSPWQYVYYLSNPPQIIRHEETAPPHGPGYNMLYSDGHIDLLDRTIYLSLYHSATHGNRDNKPHSEAWAPRSLWVYSN